MVAWPYAAKLDAAHKTPDMHAHEVHKHSYALVLLTHDHRGVPEPKQGLSKILPLSPLITSGIFVGYPPQAKAKHKGKLGSEGSLSQAMPISKIFAVFPCLTRHADLPAQLDKTWGPACAI